ncbi:MAG TPA: hypothetical protein VE172_04060 [Stackebrandtia sp.]|jgi:mannitol-specific phosphotransferase system IIBC component|uniref:hypothetical protein n=1 Tax=Stackebrandtia sp. TaxID=2023065 RepID=UPI002D5D1AD1|nr:hypothetical protein [Stackebrandtia sp.]HZE37965.1 hypothetical protein [Stackebrandtia sp.]
MGIKASDIHKVVVACDAGMGSSVMLASQLKRQLSKHNVTVEHAPVNTIPDDADVIVCHVGLAARARGSAPGKPIVSVEVFIGDVAVTNLVKTIKSGGELDV